MTKSRPGKGWKDYKGEWGVFYGDEYVCYFNCDDAYVKLLKLYLFIYADHYRPVILP